MSMDKFLSGTSTGSDFGVSGAAWEGWERSLMRLSVAEGADQVREVAARLLQVANQADTLSDLGEATTFGEAIGQMAGGILLGRAL